MKKFAFFSDVVFSFLVSALFSLFLFRYLQLSFILSLLLALLCGGLTASAVYVVLQMKRKTIYLKKSDETQKEKLLLHLALLSDDAKTRLFQQALTTEEVTATRFGRLRLYTKTEFYFLKFSLAPVCADEIANLFRLKTGKKKILLCAQIDEAAFSLCHRLEVEVKTGEYVYNLLKERNLLPEFYLGDTSKPRKRHFKLWFAKNNAKRFLISGGMVLLLSWLTPFYYYYILIGCLLLFVSIFVRIFGYE